MDRLKTLLSAELSKLTAERDEHRALSFKYKAAAEQIDKQVNRLQHFLSDYGESVDIEIPIAKQKKNGHGGHRSLGVGAAVFEILQNHYPSFISIPEVSKQIKDMGYNPASTRSAVDRLVATKKAEKIPYADGKIMFRLVIEDRKVE